MHRMIKAVLVVAACAAATPLFAGGASAGGFPVIEVTKTVEGPVPDTAEFVIEVDCDPPAQPLEVSVSGEILDPPFTQDLVFGPEGGTQSLTLGSPASCTVTETDNGGAASNTGPQDVEVESTTTYPVEVVNTFEEPTTTTTTTVETTSTTEGSTTTTAPVATAPEAVRTQPAFTG